MPFRLSDGAWLPSPSDLTSLVKPVAVTVNTAAATSQQELSFRLSQLELGQQVTGQVQGKVSDGNYLVNVNGTLAELNLPVSTQVGDHVALTLLDNIPRPVFLLNGTADNSGPASSVMTLSQTGRMISRLLSGNTAQGTTFVTSQQPVFAQFPANVTTLALGLQQSLLQSGVFYESHLNAWQQGQLPLDRLQQEPQAQLGQQLLSTIAGNTGATSTQSAPPPVMNNSQITSSDTATPSTPNSTAAQSISPSASNVLQNIVQNQLQVLEQNRYAWQGMMWPGQMIEWEVSKQSQQQSHTAPDEKPVWKSRVRLQMPLLGDVSAELRLSDGRLQIQLQVATNDSAETLKRAQPQLLQQMAAAGLPVDSILIQQHDSSAPVVG